MAVRQQKRKATLTTPLHLARGNELVDNHLCTVGEVAKLSLPDDECVGLCGGIPVLKAKHRLFRKHRVDDNKGRLLGRNILQRNMRAHVVSLTGLVLKHSMAVSESATPAVLAAQ